MAGANTPLAEGALPKTTGFCTVICILQFSLILEFFGGLVVKEKPEKLTQVMVSEVCMLPNGNNRG